MAFLWAVSTPLGPNSASSNSDTIAFASLFLSTFQLSCFWNVPIGLFRISTSSFTFSSSISLNVCPSAVVISVRLGYLMDFSSKTIAPHFSSSLLAVANFAVADSMSLSRVVFLFWASSASALAVAAASFTSCS